MYGKGEHNSPEVGRLFYLAIPPHAYENCARWLAGHVSPPSNKVWTRLVIGMYKC